MRRSTRLRAPASKPPSSMRTTRHVAPVLDFEPLDWGSQRQIAVRSCSSKTFSMKETSDKNSRKKGSAMDGVTVIDHPLVQHKLTIMRRKETSTGSFRRLLREISTLLCYEVTRDLELTMETIETPIQTMRVAYPRRQEAGLRVDPACRQRPVGRHAGTRAFGPRFAYRPLPRSRDAAACRILLQGAGRYFDERLMIVVDPMLATGNSSIAAIDKLKERGAQEYPLPLPARRTRRHQEFPRRASRRAGLHRLDRQPSQRQGLHRARPRRCRRSHVRHEVI
jgi:uracil phosphoribosyltransferase